MCVGTAADFACKIASLQILRPEMQCISAKSEGVVVKGDGSPFTRYYILLLRIATAASAYSLSSAWVFSLESDTALT